MDTKRYLERKDKNAVTLAKVGDSFALEYKKFDAETGVEIDPEVIAVNREDLLKSKADLQAQIADIDAVLKDLDALTVV